MFQIISEAPFVNYDWLKDGWCVCIVTVYGRQMRYDIYSDALKYMRTQT